MNILKEYVQFLIEQEQQQKSWGILKKELKQFIRNKKGVGVAKASLGFVPFVGGARDLFDVLKALNSIPDNKRPNGFLSKFDIDDNIKKIVDNNIEEEFVKYIVKYIEDKDDDELVNDFNMTDILNRFLQQEFAGRGVSGYNN